MKRGVRLVGDVRPNAARPVQLMQESTRLAGRDDMAVRYASLASIRGGAQTGKKCGPLERTHSCVSKTSYIHTKLS